MNFRKNIFYSRMSIYIINLITIVFLSVIFYSGIQNICWSSNARKFLEKVKNMPLSPWQIPFLAISLLIIFFIITAVRERFKENTALQDLLFLSDMFICISVVYLLNLSYKGILFLVMINIMRYADSHVKRFVYFIIVFLTFIFVDYDLMTIRFKLLSINDYIEYFKPLSQVYIFSLKSILISVNQILFMLFLVFSVLEEIKEKREIRKLYTQLVKTTEDLQYANKQLEDYAKKSEEMARTKERNRLAIEIHDTIGHTLTGVITGLDACTTIIDIDPQLAKEQLSKIRKLSKDGLVDIRRSVHALKPDVLDKETLKPALYKIIGDINECTSTKASIKISGEIDDLNAQEEDAVYRIIQESTTNAIRHGNAKAINIEVIRIEDKLSIFIRDNGSGTVKLKEGFGLRHIRERVSGLGGKVRYYNIESGGFAVEVEMSVRRGENIDKSNNS